MAVGEIENFVQSSTSPHAIEICILQNRSASHHQYCGYLRCIGNMSSEVQWGEAELSSKDPPHQRTPPISNWTNDSELISFRPSLASSDLDLATTIQFTSRGAPRTTLMHACGVDHAIGNNPRFRFSSFPSPSNDPISCRVRRSRDSAREGIRLAWLGLGTCTNSWSSTTSSSTCHRDIERTTT